MSNALSGDLLEVAGRRWRLGDAVLLGLALGRWDALEHRVAHGVTAERAAAPPPAAVDAALHAFRRERNLLTAAELRDWLDARGRTREELLAHGRRVAARGEEPVPANLGVDRAVVASLVEAEAIFDGTLARCAVDLSRHAAAAATLPVASAESAPWGASRRVAPEDIDALVAAAIARLPPGLRPPDVAESARAVLELVAGQEAFAAAVASPSALRRLLVARRLELTRVRYEQLALGSRDAAAEAVLCSRVDGVALAQVAGRAGVECVLAEGELGQIGAPVRRAITGASPGQVAGPVEDGERWLVVGVRTRVPPSLDDRSMVRRLREELVAQALERSDAGRVVWHAQL